MKKISLRRDDFVEVVTIFGKTKKCIVIKRNGETCNKVCYSDSSTCTYHINLKLKKLAKEKNKDNLQSDIKKAKRSINTIKNKINKLIKDLTDKMYIYKNLIAESKRKKNEI